jgi:hypothetical protein
MTLTPIMNCLGMGQSQTSSNLRSTDKLSGINASRHEHKRRHAV